ncbi:hypothetical protein NDR87_01085 [Nocardia sp. CDC159]|uniref:Uncharacterized protein n=1 Tax=Nocardia pulmonis TaxID=2951408 RepID=A0A9X2E3Z6_9NOCA|nr:MULTISPECIES: hypothetical protein [Nocardia]MCM6772395.1 hypothetical protein [Nocardia pulmonis]MCM6784947.1 hypothetical protein [Nocardia sp. CDC159]
MALIEIDDLPARTADVLRRRARAAGLPPVDYVRRELIALAGRPAPIDAVVEFLESERPDQLAAPADPGATALIHTYDLPHEAWSVLGRRAAAAGVSLSEHVHAELVAMARRSTIDDVMLEFEEAQQRDPSLQIDMAAIRESLRFVRGQ